MSFSCEACAAQSYEANATRYDLAATARAITPRACNLRFWFRRHRKHSYFEATSPMQVSCKPCAAQSYEANATRYDLAATARAVPPHACNRQFWFRCLKKRSQF